MLHTSSNPLVFHPEPMLAQATQLQANHSYQSSELLCRLMLAYYKQHGEGSKHRSGRSSPTWLGPTLKLLADNLYASGQLQVASEYYEQALINFANEKEATSHSQSLCQSIHSQLCQIYHKLGKSKLALHHLGQIPENQRGVTLVRILAEASEKLGNLSVACQARKEILRQLPLAYEEYVALMWLGAPWPEIQECLPTDCEFLWFHQFVKARYAIRTMQYNTALQLYQQLESKLFPDHPDLLRALAEVHLRQGNTVLAFYTFGQLHTRHPNVIRGKDSYASLLCTQGDSCQVGSLVDQLKRVHPNSPQLWLAMAHHCVSQGQVQRALLFVEKALTIQDHYAEAHLARGHLLLRLQRPTEALMAYRQAHRLDSSPGSFQGQVNSYLALRRYREAYLLAKDCLERLPDHPQVLAAMGAVLAQSDKTLTKAQRLLNTALDKDPRCPEAALTLVTVYVVQNKLNDAVALLEKQLGLQPTDKWHVRLGDVLIRTGDLSRAETEYRAALGRNPDCEPALQGLARIEQLQQTVDAQELIGEEGEGVTDDNGTLDESQLGSLGGQNLDASLEEMDTHIEYETADSMYAQDASVTGDPTEGTPARLLSPGTRSGEECTPLAEDGPTTATPTVYDMAPPPPPSVPRFRPPRELPAKRCDPQSDSAQGQLPRLNNAQANTPEDNSNSELVTPEPGCHDSEGSSFAFPTLPFPKPQAPALRGGRCLPGPRHYAVSTGEESEPDITPAQPTRLNFLAPTDDRRAGGHPSTNTAFSSVPPSTLTTPLPVACATEQSVSSLFVTPTVAKSSTSVPDLTRRPFRLPPQRTPDTKNEGDEYDGEDMVED
ncbi:Anaphase promoting complex subunit 7 [Dispira parvispora]|uniref:Anaphase promoting complex subunit 7 n=1 Tax=Dispira parvispora TaxID=1520584 RepID=A0A9W8ARL2_9FUNG|nr:Anaphase promoting complex subunit 7 [Dispira parvispora]